MGLRRIQAKAQRKVPANDRSALHSYHQRISPSRFSSGLVLKASRTLHQRP